MSGEMDGIRIAICDDCEEDRKFIKDVLDEYAKGQKNLFYVEEFESGEAFLRRETNRFALIFLDIFMTGINGMEVARTLRERGEKAMLVFCSSSREFAVESYEVNALHYLIKDRNKELLYQVLDKFFQAFPVGRSIEVKTGRERRMILMQDIVYVEANNKKCIIHTKEEEIEVTMTMSEMNELLTLPEFARPIRYAIVSLKEVTAVPTDIVRLSNGVEIPIGRGERKNMKQAFAEYRWMVSKMSERG